MMRLTVVLALLLTSGFSLLGQSEGLELYHREFRKSEVIPLGTKVVLMHEGQRVKGLLTDADIDRLAIDGRYFAIEDIVWLGVRNKISLLKGIGVVALGAVMIAGGLLTTTGVTASLVVIGGAGVGVLSLPIFRQGKRYYLDSDWKVQNTST